MTSSMRDLKVYTTYPHSCSYLEEQEATTLFVDPRQPVDKQLYSNLSLLGFRRSGSHIYRPHCTHCEACIPARIPVAQFQPRRGQTRTRKRNEDLRIRRSDHLRDEDAFQLYCRYIELRHFDGDMYPPNEEQYSSFIAVKTDGVRFFKFFAGKDLVAVCVMDQLQNGLSAVYTYFDAKQTRRSLGNFVILWQIQQARVMELPYLYLGYWVKESQKMSYKSNYRPLEILIEGKWKRLS